MLTLLNSQANDPQNTHKNVSTFPDHKNTWKIDHILFLCASNDYAIYHISCQCLGSYYKVSKCISADWTKMAPQTTHEIVMTPPDNKNTRDFMSY